MHLPTQCSSSVVRNENSTGANREMQRTQSVLRGVVKVAIGKKSVTSNAVRGKKDPVREIPHSPFD